MSNQVYASNAAKPLPMAIFEVFKDGYPTKFAYYVHDIFLSFKKAAFEKEAPLLTNPSAPPPLDGYINPSLTAFEVRHKKFELVKLGLAIPEFPKKLWTLVSKTYNVFFASGSKDPAEKTKVMDLVPVACEFTNNIADCIEFYDGFFAIAREPGAFKTLKIANAAATFCGSVYKLICVDWKGYNKKTSEERGENDPIYIDTLSIATDLCYAIVGGMSLYAQYTGASIPRYRFMGMLALGTLCGGINEIFKKSCNFRWEHYDSKGLKDKLEKDDIVTFALADPADKND